MRPHLLLPLLFLSACDRPQAAVEPVAAAPVAPGPVPVANPDEILPSVVRINTTQQSWDQAEPWQKNTPGKRRSLGAIVGNGIILTTAEMAADATYIELESPDGKKLAPAKTIAVDYEANLALLGLTDESNAKFFEGTKPLEISAPPKIGDTLDILQVEENGSPLITSGGIQSIDVVSNFLPGQFFLTYEVKASMQSAASSFSLPVLRDGKLAGLLTSYDSKDQISDVVATEIVARFVKEGSDADYAGFPSLGISISRTDDPNFRLFLKLPDDGGGLYVSNVRVGSAAEKAGLKKGDVILSIDGNDIDRLGYFVDKHYGRLYWSHLVRGAKASGDKVDLVVQRDGQPQNISAVLDRRDEVSQLVPAYAFGKAPNFLVKGGLIFQELTKPVLESFGNEWQSRAPLNLLDVYENPEKYESRCRRVVFLSNVIPTPATVGYESLQSMIVTKVNGKDIKDMKTLIEAFKTPAADGLHSIEFDEEKFHVYLDESISDTVDKQLLQRGLPKLSRADD
ncbi:S1C family serine protease [Luteolibacter soli]|uniref:PDZ domain-containing protein n=1 Tax=Luteolibacter soli TaxID=3135280 RepID=A0ABU9B4U3_9BACT